MDPQRDDLKKALEAKSFHTIRLYANQRDDSGTDYRVLLIQQAVDVVEEWLASPVPSPSADAVKDMRVEQNAFVDREIENSMRPRPSADATVGDHYGAGWQAGRCRNWGPDRHGPCGICDLCRASAPSADARAKLGQAVREWQEAVKAHEALCCNCDGGPQGDGLSEIPHAPTCPAVDRDAVMEAEIARASAEAALLALPPHEGETPQPAAEPSGWRDIVEQALKAAKQFIVNGVEFGYIQMPDPDTPDSAHETLPLIRRALAALPPVVQTRPEDQ